MKQRVAMALGLISIAVLAGCGGSSSSTQTNSAVLSKNWQLTMAPQVDSQNNPLFSGGLTGGFLIQKGNSVAGSFAYAIFPAGATVPCASGAAPISGTVSGQGVTLTGIAGGQTFTLTATLPSSGTTLMGTYATTDGSALSGGGTCGTAQTGLQWSAVSVPVLTGSVQGNLHGLGLFSISGTLVQGENTGATSATVTGEVFSDDYPCFSHASLNGTISGSSVLLNIIGDNGLPIGRIGSPGGNGAAFAPAVLQQAAGTSGLVVRGTTRDSSGYSVTTSKCPNTDGGSICLGIGTATACTQPITFSFSSLDFASQPVGSLISQPVTLTNTDPTGASADGLTLAFSPVPSEFNLLPNFQESDTCAASVATPFSLASGQSCTVTVTFSPQQSCTKDPGTNSGGVTTAVPPLRCPSVMQTQLSVQDPGSPDGDINFNVAIDGSGISAIQPVEAEIGFSALTQGQTSSPQTVTLLNTSASPVTILPAVAGAPCVVSPITVPRAPGVVPGLQVVANIGVSQFPDNYFCDGANADDPSQPLGTPTFPISADTCTGATLGAGKTCTFNVAYAPQLEYGSGSLPALDYFIQLSTLQCAGSVTASCELDSGRLPIEIKANNQSPLRISPSAGFDFGMPFLSTDTLQTFTVFNDPDDPNPATVEFLSISTKSNSRFSQTNTCGASLAPGSSCTINVLFHPTATSLAQDTVVITPKNNLTEGAVQNIYLWGRGQ